MIVLDTNVISETFKPWPDKRVGEWLVTVPAEQLFVTSVTKAELLYGLALMPDGNRKRTLASVIGAFFGLTVLNPVAGFGEQEALSYAQISAHRRRLGRPIREFDAQIAAIARTRGFAVATRNVHDFENCGIEIINPWKGPTA
jgi:toxin FitB